MQSLGQHTLLEYGGCDPALLEKAPRIRRLLCAAVRHGGGSIVKTMFHNFSPYGVSGVVVITESHVTIHTWPEHGYAAVDIFSCSSKLNHAAIRDELKRALKAKTVGHRTFQRGPSAERIVKFARML